VLDEVNNFSEFGQMAEDISIVETLAPGIVYEESVNIPPTRISGDANLGTRLEWHIDALLADEPLTISYRISATREGILAVNQDPSEVTFTNFRGSRVSMQLPRLTLEVLPPNRTPVAMFSFLPDEPTTTIDVEFRNESFDPDGNLVEYFWNFGDGVTSVLREPKHRYEQDGTYQVTLTVFDNLQSSKSLTQTIVVETKDITIVRTIDTFLSTDVTLPGEMFRVRLDIQINKSLNGMGIREDINQSVPDDWVINSVSHDAAKFNKINAVELQWVFLEVLNPGDSRTIIYEVSLPETTTVGTFVFNGVASSVSPNIEVRTRGDAQVEVRSSLSILTVVSRWDPPSSDGETGSLDMTLTDMITFDQVQVAVGWWLNSDSVPHSGDRDIDFSTIQIIIAHWLTNTTITEPLPGTDGSDDEA
jgi:PKD repeat protein